MDSMTINNPPYDLEDGELISNTKKFFRNILNIELKEVSLKASLLLSGKKQLSYGLMAGVTVKFVYFEENNHV